MHGNTIKIVYSCVDGLKLTMYFAWQKPCLLLYKWGFVCSVILCNVRNMTPSSDGVIILKQFVFSERIARSVRDTYHLVSSRIAILSVVTLRLKAALRLWPCKLVDEATLKHVVTAQRRASSFISRPILFGNFVITLPEDVVPVRARAAISE